MISKLTILKDRLERLSIFAPIVVEEVIQGLAPVIEDLLANQLQRGERGDGTILPNYSPVSVHVYGKPAGPIRLYDTGAFYRGMQLHVTTKDFEIIDSDHKTPMLTERYGDNILQLSETSLAILREDYLVEEVSIKLKNFLLE